jgi:hypothetical protein
VNWETHQIGIPGATAKDKENRRIPFNPNGRLAAILKRRSTLGPDAFVFGSTHGAYQPTIQTAWETLKLLANGLEPTAGHGVEGTSRRRMGARVTLVRGDRLALLGFALPRSRRLRRWDRWFERIRLR